MSRWLQRAALDDAWTPLATIATKPTKRDISSVLSQTSQGSVIETWRSAVAGMPAYDAPCPGFRHWPSVRREALRFLDERGIEAVDLGWGVLDLLGVHRGVGTIRADCSGALLGLRGRSIIDLTKHLIRFADGLAYRRRPVLAGLTIPIWKFQATNLGGTP